ncbi:helix-turn-helix domain-containing protein [Streptomyces sp. NPDC008079]|uniref:helix-turn-helix domain-containing protein n=1 Tax=Streptomyces sp. NPDC008079 TaxID=3364806 RepID=UPI0036E96B89
MTYKGVPTIRKRLLGRELERRRNAIDMPIADVAKRMGVSESTVRRQESGHTATPVPDLEFYFKLYEIPEDDPMRTRLEDWSRQGRKRGPWTEYRDTVGPTAADIADAEEIAASIQTYQPLVVPGILQTADYSAAVLRAAEEIDFKDSPYDIEDMIQLRERRKQVLKRTPALAIWAVIGEAAIMNAVGGEDVLKEQVEHLLRLSGRGNISIQILPINCGAHVGLNGAFFNLSFDESTAWDLTFHEGGKGTFDDDPSTVRLNSTRFGSLQAQALPYAASRTYLQEALAKMAARVG